MSLGLRLDVRQSQGLVLTPQLQQAIKLLQLSNIELASVVARELAENPFLTPVEGPVLQRRAAVDRERPLDGRPAADRRAREAGAADGSRAPPSDCRLRATRAAPGDGADLDGDRFERLVRKPSLAEHLRAQLAGETAPRPIRDLALQLVDLIAEDGYIRESDAELCALLGAGAEAVAAARALLLRCDPAGVGARDLAQCLAAQLAERDRLDPAMAALLEHLPAVARADFALLQRVCGVDLEDLREMIAELKQLDPRPGLAFDGPEPVAVVPDLVVTRLAEGGWRVELNQASLPRVLVDRDYYGEIVANGVSRRDREFLSERYQAATWLAKALDQRARTVLRVGKAILSHQRGFLEHGARALRPLVLREIAEVTGLHESTVSRATADKFVATPRGTFPLRYFFTTAIQAADGEAAHSAEAIRQLIRQLVDAEAAHDVLSDDQIVSVLKERGIAIARRTVAKYRESLGIASSVQRRRARALGS
jgi:RNA polymerase sigma-54 factor